MTSVLVNSGYGEPPRKKNTDLRINENKLERCGRLLSVDMRTLHHPLQRKIKNGKGCESCSGQKLRRFIDS